VTTTSGGVDTLNTRILIGGEDGSLRGRCEEDDDEGNDSLTTADDDVT